MPVRRSGSRDENSVTRSYDGVRVGDSDAPAPLHIHLLDVGPQEYGDSILCQFGDVTVLIDGAHSANWQDDGDEHPSIPRQIGELLGVEPRGIPLSLLIVTHAHEDHIGCLPTLVAKGLIKPEWALVADPALGWGLTPDDSPGQLADDREPVRQLAALFREEPRTGMSDAALAALAADAATLEDRYNDMVDRLERAGTKVVRYGRDDTAALEAAFRKIGMKILGPSTEVLVHCAEMIRGRSKRLNDAADGLLTARGVDARTAAPRDVVSAYRSLVRPAGSRDAANFETADLVDATNKDKGAINDQSIVVRFKFNGETLLFTGDMQLSEPEVSDEFVDGEIRGALRSAISREAPYALVKLPHHGSYNGIDEDVYEACGRPLVIGLCAGSGSRSHPNPKTLDLLRTLKPNGVRWARTDRNGLTNFSFAGANTEIEPTRGRINDLTPPGRDEGPAVQSTSVTRGSATIRTSEASSGTQPAIVEVDIRTRVPAGMRVVVTVEAQGKGGTPSGSRGGGDKQGPFDERPFALADGRELPRLLFVTNRAALAANVGEQEAVQALEAIRQAGHGVIDDVSATSAASATTTVRRRIARDTAIKGVVLVGGHDVVPLQRVDTLPARLRDALRDNDDADDFFVWTDDGYGDRDGDWLPELPVSRVPDGRSSRLLFASLSAPSVTGAASSTGIRNQARPFADRVYATLAGAAPMLQSRPIQNTHVYDLGAHCIYVMLHGSADDCSQFWGEDGRRYPVAMGVGNVPDHPGMVVFTGCCWGGLVVAAKARDASPSATPAPLTAESSIALACLSHRARAFVGCTGSHYSPSRGDMNYFGRPMHDAFWRRYNGGMAPAQALLAARAEYMTAMPHGEARESLIGEAIEFKILRQYTCLGLGW